MTQAKPNLETRINRLKEIEPLAEAAHTMIQGALAYHRDPNAAPGVTEFMVANAEQKLDHLATRSAYATNLEQIARSNGEAHTQRGVTLDTLRGAVHTMQTQQTSMLEQLTDLAQRLPSAEQAALLDLIRINQAAQDDLLQALNNAAS